MSEAIKQKGNDEYRKGNFQKADQLYQKAIHVSPENVLLYSNRAMTLLKLENWEECLTVCQQGLALKQTNEKTTMKLKWRSGLALTNLNQFSKARECFAQALTIEKTNKSIQESLRDLDKREQMFKRTISDESLAQGKRFKSDSRFRIPIFEVDRLPDELLTYRNKTEERDNNIKNSIGPTPHTAPCSADRSIVVNNQVAQTLPSKIFPKIPTIHQLSSIIKSSDITSYEYCFGLSSDILRNLFAGGNIDASFINFFLRSIDHKLKCNTDKENILKTLKIMEALSSSPRFILARMMLNTQLLDEIKMKLEIFFSEAKATDEDLTCLYSVIKSWFGDS